MQHGDSSEFKEAAVAAGSAKSDRNGKLWRLARGRGKLAFGGKDAQSTPSLNSAHSRVRELASGMRQLAGTKTRNRRAHAAPLA